MAVDIVCNVSTLFSSQGLGCLGFLQTMVFPMLYLSDIHAGSNNSTQPNISGHQLRRIDHTLSHTTRLPRY
jgi:hypothetical protein